jgi:glucose/arabinose dehydrogenase
MGQHWVMVRSIFRLRVVGLALVIAAIPSLPASSAGPGFALRKVTTADRPVGFVTAPNGSFYVLEQRGKLRHFDGKKVGDPILNVTEEISDGNEQGLLGAAFANGGDWLYVNLTNTEGDTEIRAYPYANDRVDAAKMVLLLKVDQPYANHNGGGLVVDQGGILWIGLGDGGSAGDPENRAQNLDTLLGKILRIVPTPEEAKPYRIPDGNLDASRGRPEIWAWGLRNPWRFTIDATTKTVWIGDVGQGDREEIDAVPVDTVHANFGWRPREGTRAYDGGSKPDGSIEPVHDYSHSSGGCSVTGGVVYRGRSVASLRGAYLFADFCDGKIRVIRRSVTGGPVGVKMSGLKLKNLSSFGVDTEGEIYVASTDGAIAKIVSR